MTKEQALQQMQRLVDEGADTEGDHMDADRILCEFLKTLGHGDLVDVYDELDRWFA